MIWFLRDIDLLSILARAATLSFEALLLGGIAFLLAVAKPARASEAVEAVLSQQASGWRRSRLIVAEVVMVSASGAILMSGSDLTLKDVLTTNFFRADSCAIMFAIGLWISAQPQKQQSNVGRCYLLSLLLLASVVSTSHAAARIDHRVLLVILTAAHHLGTAAWLGAMPYLLISLGRAESVDEARRLTERYSRMALLGAATLVLAGGGLAWSYRGIVERALRHCVWRYGGCQDAAFCW